MTLTWGPIRCYLGVLILDQCLAMQAPTNCPMTPRRRDLRSVQYQPALRLGADFSFISGFVHSFLGTVQPNPFPKKLFQSFVEGNNIVQNPDTIKEVLRYETGFLVCAAIGLLYLVLVPLVGLCLACCRCFDHCGGRMYQEQSQGIHVRRRGLFWATLITTIFILAGNACMFQSNQLLDMSVEQSPQGLGNVVTNLQIYLSAVPQQIHTVVNESFLTIDEIAKNLMSIDSSLGTEIQSSIHRQVSKALKSVHEMSAVVNSTKQDLVQFNNTLRQLQPKVAQLQAELNDVKIRVNRTLPSNTTLPELNALSLNAKFTVPNLMDLQSAVDRADFDAQVRQGWEFLQSIPRQVSNQSRDAVQSIEQQLVQIKGQISHLSEDLPLHSLNDVSEQMKTVRTFITKYSPQILGTERYRWAVCLVLCFVVLLVVLCNALGLLLGPMGLQPKADPTKRSDTANCGGLFLMASAGFSFLFGWIFMLLVLVLFLTGGNLYTLVCVPWQSQELFQIIDTPGMIPGLSLSETLHLKTKLTLSEVYSDCHQNMSLWNTLHLSELFNLDQFLNISKIYNFSNTILNISGTLDHLADKQTNISVKAELQQLATALRGIQNNVTVNIMPMVHIVDDTLQSLGTILSHINDTVGNVLTDIEEAQNFLNSNTSEIVKTISRRFLECQMAYFTSYIHWANKTITQEIGRCGPVAGVVDTVGRLACSYIVESLNAFWFSLGWCLIFLIPNIIFSIKLAKFYRRMKHKDVLENHIQLTHIPRATME
uniref:Prominin 2 n=1 Tax=Scleropages formosus TaxID=113540 RepID=A0A8C9RV71_SCLFO